MASRIIDLHMHSKASDGTDSPAELAGRAAAAGLAAFALTDHDTLAGVDEAGEQARRLGIEFVPGIEIAVADPCGELHILGLFMPPPSTAMRAALDGFRRNRRERNLAILDRLAQLGMALDLEEVRALSRTGAKALGRPHIALALREKGCVHTIKEAFERYLGYGAAAYVPRRLLGPEEGIGLLAREGAIVALAHPCLEDSMTPERLDNLLAAFKGYGLNALEAYHSAHDHKQTRLCVELAARHGLLLTGGSDYHGANKPGIAPGRGAGSLRVPYLLLEKMRAAAEERKKLRGR